MTQIEKLKEAIRLAEENDAEIHFLVSSEFAEDYTSTAHLAGKVELAWWGIHNDRVYTDPEELADVLTELDESESEWTEEAAEALMKRVVIIHTFAG